MGQFSEAGLVQLVDVVDVTSKAGLEAVDATKDAVAATGHAAINVGDKTIDVAIDEAEKLRASYVDSLRRIAQALSSVSPV